MPVNQAADFLLNGKPFMLWRNPKGGQRSWKRERVPDTLTTQRRLWRSISQPEVYGGLPDELDHPEIWDDWSGGFGYYRQVDKSNHFHIGFNVDTRFPGQAFLAQAPQLLPAGLGGNLKIAADFFLDVPLPVSNPIPGAGSILTVNLGAVSHLTPTSPNTFDTATEVAPSGGLFPFGHRPALFGSYVYLPNLAGSGFHQRSLDGTSLVQGSLPASNFAVAAGRLWKSWGNSLQSCAVGADPMTASNWSASINIGNGFLNISDLYGFQESVYAGMPDGLYVGDQTGTFNNVATNIGAAVTLDNVRDISDHNGGVVFAAADSAWWYKPSTGANSELREIWPNTDIRPFASLWSGLVLDPGIQIPVNGLSMKGRITALKGYGQWLYAGVFTGTMSFIFAGRDASGAGPYVWHPMQALPGVKISRIHIDQVTVPSGGHPGISQRMWVGAEGSFGLAAGATGATYFWPIPKGNGHPLADAAFSGNSCLFGLIEQSVTDSDVPGVWKLWRKMETWLEGVGKDSAAASDSSASASIEVNMMLDGTMAATFDSTLYFQKPKDWHYFDNTNNDAIANSALTAIKLNAGWHFQGAGGSGNSMPVVHALVGHNVFRPRIAEQITARVRIADGVQDRFGNEMRPGAVMLDELDTMSRASNPFPLVDLVGRAYPVVVLPGVDEEEAYQGADDYPEVMATVKLGVIDASWNAAPTVPFHPDGG